MSKQVYETPQSKLYELIPEGSLLGESMNAINGSWDEDD